ncbi:MAG TPA: hypothetical protein VFS56_07690 [Gemmatimonadaceae bacterium]|nr:hypothetical protein [Gemmatimonadaceae bacterium]
MRRCLVRVATVGVAVTTLAAMPAPAQRVLGIGEDALVLPRGMLRVRTLGQWTSFNERYGLNTPGRESGSLEPLGIDFVLDTVGVREFPNLNAGPTGLQEGLRALTGNPAFNLSLGSTRLDLRAQVTAVPFVIEAGLSRRFSLGIQVPYVQTRNSAFFDVNPNQREGNLGFNPALAVPAAAAQNALMFSQFQTAAASLQTSLDACAANPGASPSCPALNAQRSNAQALIANSTAFAGGVNQIYSSSPFVPIRNTDAQLAIEARVAAFRALYAQFGVNDIAPTTTGPFASQNTLTAADAQTILTDPLFGVQADPIQTVTRSHVGDIDVGGKFLLLDTFGNSTVARMQPEGLNFRLSVGGVVRLPTGQAESPDNFIDIGGGQGQTDLEGRVFADLLLGSRFWQSFVVRYNAQLADDQHVRITDLPNRTFAPLYRRQKVERNLGDIFEFETTPRIVVNDFFAVSGQYVYRAKSSDRYAGTFAIPAAVTGFADITLDASTLDLETEQKEHRLGGGISFSNLYAYEQKKAGIPFEVTYLHWQTVKGSGNVPKAFTDQIQLRLYARVFGN